jgi:general stress protein CsbA
MEFYQRLLLHVVAYSNWVKLVLLRLLKLQQANLVKYGQPIMMVQINCFSQEFKKVIIITIENKTTRGLDFLKTNRA